MKSKDLINREIQVVNTYLYRLIVVEIRLRIQNKFLYLTLQKGNKKEK